MGSSWPGPCWVSLLFPNDMVPGWLLEEELIMKVKVGDKVCSDEDLPIMVVLTETDKFNLKNMLAADNKYASAPDDYFDNSNDFLKWMREGLEKQDNRHANKSGAR